MTPGKLFAIVYQNVRRNRKNFLFSTFGITVGVSVFSFFLALTMGIRDEVLNRIYPVDLIEVEPAAVNFGGTKQSIERVGFNNEGVDKIEDLEGVGAVFPKLRSRFQATYRMGGQIFGQNGVTFEAYFDGLDSKLLRNELRLGEDQRSRRETKDRLKEQYGRKHRCYDSQECTPGEQCEDGYCEETLYWSLFRDRGEVIPCSSDVLCADGYGCIYGHCRRLCEGIPGCYEGEQCQSIGCTNGSQCGTGGCEDGQCADQICVQPALDGCSVGQERVADTCDNDGHCTDGPCVDGSCLFAGLCAHIPCEQKALETTINANPDLQRGEIPGLCEDGTPVPNDGTCRPARCPYGSFCSVANYGDPGNPRRDRRGRGFCELPIPVVLNPMVLELFNMVLDSTMDRGELGSVDTLLGYMGSVFFGHSFYKETVQDRVPVEKKLIIVGFSNKALEAGATMPMEYVRRANARYKGKGATREFDSFIIQLSAAEYLPEVMDTMDSYRVQLSRRSSEAQKFRIILVVAIAIFTIMASIILGIAAVNITHTFLMIIYERKREIGIQRALGGTKMDIRATFLLESLLIGLTGGILGNLIAWGASWLTDWGATNYMGNFPFQPDTFFSFHWEWIAASFAFATIFSIIGAFFPANQAASMDPAKTLTLN